MKKKPNVYVIAGANGAGKTTFARQFLPLYVKCRVFVNADLIAQGLAPFAPDTVSLKAGKLLLKELDAQAAKKNDFSFETTLSGKSYVKFLKELRQMGYNIHIFYLWIPSVKLALHRVEERVSVGGHDVAVKDIKRRFLKSMDNFLNVYKPLADHWVIINNGGITPFTIASGDGKKTKIFDEALFKQVMKRQSKG